MLLCKDKDARNYETFFNVFKSLAVSLVIGRAFLDATDTLNKYSHRLSTVPQILSNIPRLMHLNRPHRRMRCYLDENLVYANADTGAEMNLISPAFAAQRKYQIKKRKRDNSSRTIELADGSTVEVSTSVQLKFSPFVSSLSGIKYEPQYATFYVLEGLTTDALLGDDILFGMNAFTQHQRSFIDISRLSTYGSLNLITWLKQKEGGLLSTLRGKKRSQRIANEGNQPQGSADATEAAKTQEEIQLANLEIAFQRDLAESDAKELYRREAADTRNKAFSTTKRAVEETLEENRRAAYDDARVIRIQQHQDRLSSYATLMLQAAP